MASSLAVATGSRGLGDSGKREVIAILNTGGTFSALTGLNAELRDTTLPDHARAKLKEVIDQNLDRHLLSYFGMTRRVGNRARDVAVEWWDVRKDDFIFSENATPAHWLRLAELLREHLSQSLDRVVGVVVIHGTDTLASAAAALEFMVRRQSMPIVFVAANRPLLDDRGQDGRLSSFASDAWPNLLLALTFILACGHTYKHMALSFSNRIHFPINLRKVSGSRAALAAVPQYQMDQRLQGRFVRPEAFVFRNLLMVSPFLCQEIGGQLCSDPVLSWPLPKADDAEENILDLELPDGDDSRAWIKAVVEHVHATSSPGKEPGDGSGSKVLLVETYASGTIPTDPDHVLTKRLQECRERDQVIVLVGPYGIDLAQCYDHDALAELGIRCLRLGPIIPETAVPLIALVSAIETLDRPQIRSGALEQLLHKRITSMAARLGMIASAGGGSIVDAIGAKT